MSQTRPPHEVIVVDDGSEPPASVPEHVRLVRADGAGPGAARAAGLSAARYELLAFCDDDDEWLPEHLEVLTRFLDAHPDTAVAYGDSEWHIAGVSQGVAWSFHYDTVALTGGNYIFPSDALVVTALAKEAGGFNPKLAAFEDWDLWLRMSLRYPFRHIPRTLGRCHWVDDCVQTRAPFGIWSDIWEQHEQRLNQAGEAARHSIVLAKAPATAFKPKTWSEGRRELIWHSIVRAGEGYGNVGLHLLRTLSSLGVDIRVAPTNDQAPIGLEKFWNEIPDWGRLCFYYSYRVRPGVMPCERIVSYSMWESTAVPQSHIVDINAHCRLHLVPCRQNAAAFVDAGLSVPVQVLHHGVSSHEFPRLQRQERHCYTFGTFGDAATRKGIDVLIRAFEDEFSPWEDARLIVKGRPSSTRYESGDSRIRFFDRLLDHAALLEFLRSLDCFILPSRGEGFGLCGIEAMSTGLPLIATNWSGPAEYLDPHDSYPLSYELVVCDGAKSNGIEYNGKWAEPNYEELRSMMRHLFEHPEEGIAKGERASARVHAEWTWERVALQLLAHLDRAAQK